MKRTTATVTEHTSRRDTQHLALEQDHLPAIFGLRYLEEEATEIHDVVGCLSVAGSCTNCDDVDHIH